MKQTMSLSIDSLPKFDGRHYKKWADNMDSVLMMMDIKAVVTGTLRAPITGLSEPAIPTGTPATTAGGQPTPPTSGEWSQYNALLAQFERQNKAQKEFDEKNLRAMGVLSKTLITGIWEQVRLMTTAKAWTWLETSYSRQQFVEILEDFKVLINFKIDLSDPNPQIAKFRFHYSRLPQTPADATANPPTVTTPIVSQSMACLILLSALPLAIDPTQEGVYQSTLEEYIAAHPVHMMTLDTLTEALRTRWAARFGHLPDSQKPRKGTFYITKEKKSGKPKKEHVQSAQPQVQKTSSIKDKGPLPKYSDQQAGSSKDKGKGRAIDNFTPSPPVQHTLKRTKNRRAPRRPNARIAIDDVSDAEPIRFEIASPSITLAERLSLPAPPRHIFGHAVASFTTSGLSVRTAKEQKAWRAPGNTPYTIPKQARMLAE